MIFRTARLNGSRFHFPFVPSMLNRILKWRGPLRPAPSLEKLVETEALKVESLHPGGLSVTDELANLCNIHQGSRVIDLACGTGETACFLAERFGARVIGIDRSAEMIHRAEQKAHNHGLPVEFRLADVHELPLPDADCDAAIIECTLSMCHKEKVLGEMVRAVRPGGSVGISDLFWKESAPKSLKEDLEGETPETPVETLSISHTRFSARCNSKPNSLPF
ncbi:MAG: class I SAM-dependent methyltransferase [Acidobacteria bacterium]|nr:class I SAM-dependent methyltransferase [Acidobacteriota bacterium]